MLGAGREVKGAGSGDWGLLTRDWGGGSRMSPER